MRFHWRIALAKKLFCFVGIASAMVLAVVGAGISYYSQMERLNLFKDDMHRIAAEVLSTRVAEKIFLQFRTPEVKRDFDDRTRNVKLKLEAVRRQKVNAAWQADIESIEKMFQEYQDLLDELMHIQGDHSELKAKMVVPIAVSEKILTDIIYQLMDKQDELRSRDATISSDDNGMLNMVTDCRTAILQLQILQLRFLLTGDEKLVEEYKRLSALTAERYVGQLEHYASISENPSFSESVAKIKESLDNFLRSVDLSKQFYGKEKEKTQIINELGAQIIASTDALLKQIDLSIAVKKNITVITVLTIGCVGLLIFWALSFILVASITRPIRKVIGGLSQSAQQVALSSRDVSMSSRQLADGTSEQAASIEETSSSLEEMSSMTRQNAENTQHVNLLMNETKEIMKMANESMKALNVSMEEIVRASNETSKIIQSIEEIAFQTNLLALNAAVEAARAGENGAGFAVVSEEVRRLALRAGDAAKNTAHLIDQTIIKIKQGVEIAQKTGKGFSRGGDVIVKIGALVSEITEASGAQSQGIEEINRAVSEIERVVQENAAHAEQSANASNEMTTQFLQLNAFVEQLAAVLDGKKGQMEKIKGVANDQEVMEDFAQLQRL
ncbi:MAG: methyl-accepting chemotaxis protein [Pseudomonadota bacterium]